ncbi:AcrR family transcriptional regulator [Nocardioides thalensis]|uniref:AcrR family transcriptional regulator n=1 Tax=Nocardioides thalensis TaxID=1914755 RepID=A0A853C2R3_9ACTN|nr:AcrR family transcriptional regulator [Nocardioides thalensis]
MPANKRQQDREEKRAELLAEARRLFIEHGYEGTSMAALAKAAGVAGNTIYWYFADKDDVLVAVLDAVLSDALAEYEEVAAAPLEDQLGWVVRRLQQMHRLVNTVHSRAAHSPAVDAWHTGFHQITEGMFRATLERAGVDHADIDAEVKIGVFAVEGLLTHGLDDAQQQAICRRLARQWTTHDHAGRP